MSKTPACRGYHHGDLRQSIIEAACKHLRESGADTLSLRALARDVGVSQTAPYRHFESKTALFAAIAVYGFKLLEIDLRAARDTYPDDIEAAIIEVGLAYIKWATENPEKYQLFFDSSLVDISRYPDLIEAGQDAFEIIGALIKRGIEASLLADKPIELLAGSLWASVHGVASLLISKSEVEIPDLESRVLGVINQLKTDPRASLELFLNSIRA